MFKEILWVFSSSGSCHLYTVYSVNNDKSERMANIAYPGQPKKASNTAATLYKTFNWKRSMKPEASKGELTMGTCYRLDTNSPSVAQISTYEKVPSRIDTRRTTMNTAVASWMNDLSMNNHLSY